MRCQLCQSDSNNTPSLLQTLGLITRQEKQLCHTCEADFSVISMGCLGCGRQQKDEKLCYDCHRWQQQGKKLLRHTALYQYNDIMRQFMQQYKFNGDYDLRVIFNRQLSQKMNTLGADIIVPIPVSEHTMVTRGFNQTIGLITGVQYKQLLKVSAVQKQHQSQFDRQMRMTRHQPFSVTESMILKEKQILLVDDVYTTGNTLYHAADLMYELGAKNVKSISLSR